MPLSFWKRLSTMTSVIRRPVPTIWVPQNLLSQRIESLPGVSVAEDRDQVEVVRAAPLVGVRQRDRVGGAVVLGGGRAGVGGGEAADVLGGRQRGVGLGLQVGAVVAALCSAHRRSCRRRAARRSRCAACSIELIALWIERNSQCSSRCWLRCLTRPAGMPAIRRALSRLADHAVPRVVVAQEARARARCRRGTRRAAPRGPRRAAARAVATRAVAQAGHDQGERRTGETGHPGSFRRSVNDLEVRQVTRGYARLLP